MNYSEIIQNIRSKSYHPVYFVYGEESYYIDRIAEEFEKGILEEAQKEFNLSIFYGGEVAIDLLITSLRRFPMAAEHQVVILKEAQRMINFEKLSVYLENPQPSTLFLICYKAKSPDKRKTFTKLLLDKSIHCDSPKLYENQIPAWINNYLGEKEFQIKPAACALLTEYLGNDLMKITNELGKLIINIEKGSTITEELIEKYIGISRDYNVFELHNALGARDHNKAFRIVNYFSANPKAGPFVLTIGAMYAYFSKIFNFHHLQDRSPRSIAQKLGVNPYFVKDYELGAANYPLEKTKEVMRLLSQYDLKSKGVNNASVNDGELLKEMVYKILN